MSVHYIPGDPVGLRGSITRLRTTVDELDDIESELRKVASQIRSRGEAADELREITGEIGDVVGRARTRYEGVRSALATYVVTLDTVQQTTEPLVGADQRARDAVDAARRERNYYAVVALVPGPDQQEMIQRLREAQLELGAAQSTLSGIETAFERAQSDLETAAQIAIDQIEAAMNSSGLNDDFWDYLRAIADAVADIWDKYILPFLDDLQKWLADIIQILSILSLILTIASIFFPALLGVAAALRLLVLGLELLNLALQVTLALDGRRSLGDVISSAISVALSSIGAGKDFAAVGNGVFSPISSALNNGGLSNLFDPTILKNLQSNLMGLANSPAAREALAWPTIGAIFEPITETGKELGEFALGELQGHFVPPLLPQAHDFIQPAGGFDAALLEGLGGIAHDLASGPLVNAHPASANLVIDAMATDLSSVMEGAITLPSFVFTPVAA